MVRAYMTFQFLPKRTQNKTKQKNIKHETTVNQSCLNSAQEELRRIIIVKSGLGPQKDNNKRGIRGIPWFEKLHLSYCVNVLIYITKFYKGWVKIFKYLLN